MDNHDQCQNAANPESWGSTIRLGVVTNMCFFIFVVLADKIVPTPKRRLLVRDSVCGPPLVPCEDMHVREEVDMAVDTTTCSLVLACLGGRETKLKAFLQHCSPRH